MDHREKILTIVKEKGPLLPGQINKELRTNVLFASAMLSEMVDQKKIHLSSMKVGGSPLYYCDGQEPALAEYADRLQMNEKNAYDLLQNSKILRDRDQNPQTRVSLRELKDFAVPLEVNANGESDLFWKYYLVQDGEAESLIKDYINAMAAPKETEPAKEIHKEVQSKISETPPEPPKVEPEPVEPEPIVEAPVEPVTQVKMTQLEEKQVPEFSYEPSVSFSTTIDTDEKMKIEKPEPEPEGPEPMAFPEDDDFFNKVKAYLDGSEIEITEFENVRTGSEYDFTIRLPSNVGYLNYYCKAKSKSKLNEGDLSTAFVYGNMKKLPILILTMGDLTKKAEELLDKEFKNMFVKKI